MFNIIKNNSLNELHGLIESQLNKSISNLPKKFIKQQEEALMLFKKRVFLEELIEETILFNKNTLFDKKNDFTFLVNSAEELVDVFKLRSEVYGEINYLDEFPDFIDGLNFDIFDKTSAIVYTKRNNIITSTCRLIFDSQNKLPAEEKFSFDTYRKKGLIIGEISRNIVKNRTSGLNLEFKYSMAAMHNVFINNKIDLTLSGIKKEHYRLFSKFGGINIEKELDVYGTFDVPCVIISWDCSKASNFFKRSFLT